MANSPTVLSYDGDARGLDNEFGKFDWPATAVGVNVATNFLRIMTAEIHPWPGTFISSFIGTHHRMTTEARLAGTVSGTTPGNNWGFVVAGGTVDFIRPGTMQAQIAYTYRLQGNAF